MHKGNARITVVLGILLLLAGAGLVAWSHRVLATFFLDGVVLSLQPGGMEPYEFSWGTMVWGRSGVDFTVLCGGFVALALGQLLVAPRLGQLRGAKWVAAAAGVLMLAAALAFVWIPIATKGAFGTIAVAGAVDPLAMAEDMPVMASRVFAGLLVLSQVMLAVAAWVGAPGPASGAASKLAYAAGGCGVLVAVLLLAIRLGPLRVFLDIVEAPGTIEAADLAKQVSLTIQLLFAVSPLLLAGALLWLLAALKSDREIG
jgi:hypothetical protein